MRAINLHLPHLHLPRVGRPHFSMPHRKAGEHAKTRAPLALGNAWALLLAAIVAMAVLIGLWMSSNAPPPMSALPML
ncbi:hypothetical protein [Phenylobacterium sp.]|uniref:hypothetical protein n=1 Tax=Phenylobacterium sp. TaxID=1871053 RepID=UPI002735CF5A|nr:hypothetical protein [Phenylobacterium sp.]MDP3852488.1 hypothetical protein [Phenylobacterium sp.]